ncbi:MAG: formylglycine-generating enzyme family protein [Candidatus Omnitrophica bacterium]|nr:formylglycine-generating enzyme family protein [Candidatus Omnitrophota bacterium]
MGGDKSDADRYKDEAPPHPVRISHDFYFGKTEITQAQWESVMGDNPSQISGDLNAPVDSVSWEDCQAFLVRLNQFNQGTFRLPTEAEWEYACRAGAQSRYYWGENPSEETLITVEESDLNTEPIQKTPNSVWVTDAPDSNIDLCNRLDIDSENDRELTIHWNLAQDDLKDVHVYMQVDGDKKNTYVGRTGAGEATMLRWRSGTHFLNEPFQNGPEDGHSYRFLVFGINPDSSKPVSGPFMADGPVTFKTHSYIPPAVNGFGLHDMCWNVWEWCQDWYDDEYYERSLEIDPVNKTPSQFRVCRGGSKYNSPRFQRSSARGKANPETGYFYIGFRIVREL